MIILSRLHGKIPYRGFYLVIAFLNLSHFNCMSHFISLHCQRDYCVVHKMNKFFRTIEEEHKTPIKGNITGN